MKTLIFRLSSIGDIVLTGPFLRSLHTVHPDANVTFVTRKEFAEVVRHLPYVAEVISVDTGLGKQGLHEIRTKLRNMEFDHVFDLHDNFRTRFLRKGLGGELHVYRKSPWKWMALVGGKWNLYDEIVPIAERYIQSANVAGMTPDTLPPEMRITEELTASLANYLPSDATRPLIAICPGAKHFTKRYPLPHLTVAIRILLNETAAQFVVLGGTEDAEFGKTLAALEASRVLNLCGQLSIMQSAAVLRSCSGAISNDSGLMHMATAVGTPVAAVFGCTVQEFGFFPYNAPAAILEVEGLSCRPCTHIGRKSCPKGHFKCMEGIPPEDIAATVTELAAL